MAFLIEGRILQGLYPTEDNTIANGDFMVYKLTFIKK